MDSLRSMNAFVRSLELGSLSAAARELHTTQPTVSKLVAALERSVGVRLLQRATTRLALTDEGRLFYERAKRILEDHEEAVAAARGHAQAPRGLLRVSAPLALGQCRLNALMLEFLRGHPDIEVELILDDRFVDLVEEGVDVAVRAGGTLPPHVVARPVGSWPRCLVASPGYLAAKPKLRRPEDLSSHDYIRYAWASDDAVALTGPAGRVVSVPVHCRYRVNSALAILEAVMQGHGVALEPAWMVADLVKQRRLVRVLPRWAGPSQDAWLLHAPRRHLPLRVRVLLDFLAERIPRLPGVTKPPRAA